MSRSDLLVVAGEASGDLHAARLLQALNELRPDLRAFGLGSRQLEVAGARLIAQSDEISVVGISEALSVLKRAKEIFRELLAEVDRVRPAAAVLVDFPEFNLRLARELKWRGVPVVYYVSPQIWAWRRWRVRSIADTVDRMLVLFAFETAFYRRHGVPVTHVGHPLVDEVPRLRQAWDDLPRGTLPQRFEIALLPGSRASEVESLLGVQLDTLNLLRASLDVGGRLILAPSIPRRSLENELRRSGLEGIVRIVESDRLTEVAGSHLAICASGTATLETGLLGTPLLMVYRLKRWTWRLARLMVRVPHAALVNLVLEERVVPELLQGEANAPRIAAEAEKLLRSRVAVDRMRSGLARLRDRLGKPGAAHRAAEEVAALLAERERAA